MLGGAGLAAAVALLGVALYFTVLTVTVKLDGTTVRLPSGATVADLFARNLVDKRRGDLVSAKDHLRVLKSGGGGEPFVSSEGRPIGREVAIGSTPDLTSHDGTDAVEPTRVSTETIKAPIEYLGSGPIETVVTNGTSGVREVTTGAVSGEVVSRRVKVKPVARVVRRENPYAGAKVVALTFDDGPWPGSTKAIVAILQKNGVKATFFEIGRQVRQMPDISRYVANAGMEMANHSDTHPLNLGKLSASGVSKQITQAQNEIAKASGKRPKFFRPPGGNTTSAMYPVLSKLHLGWVQWDVDTDDWRRPSAEKIVSRVVKNVRPGSVVLMHDGGGDRSSTIKALPTIIQRLKAMGYTFVTVDQLPSVPHRMG